MQEQLARHSVVSAPSKIKAAQYLRMSTENQRYSLAYQRDAIADFATQHGFEIVRSYVDKGRSGLTVKGRDALSRLLRDVVSESAKFRAILVYDVSRWGRFQDADESAHYEFLCRRHGFKVEYCAEHFENDGTPMATIIKGVKRAMAGEYSRELSVKTAVTKRKAALQGYWTNGKPGFGYRRGVVTPDGELVRIMEEGDRKALQNFRTKLFLGPEEEVEIVRQMFRWRAHQRLSGGQIADRLNSQRKRDRDKFWTASAVRHVLGSEKYTGTLIVNKSTYRLKTDKHLFPPEEWIRLPNMVPAIIDKKLYDAARKVSLDRSRKYTEAEIIEDLSKAFEKHGKITAQIVRNDRSIVSSSPVLRQFGSYSKAFSKIGAKSRVDQSWRRLNERSAKIHRKVKVEVNRFCRDHDRRAVWLSASRFQIEDTFVVRIAMLKSRPLKKWQKRWEAMLSPCGPCDFFLAPLLDQQHRTIECYYLVPSALVTTCKIKIGGETPDAYREFKHASLEAAMALLQLVPMETRNDESAVGDTANSLVKNQSRQSP